MKRFIEGDDRNQSTLLPECLEDYVSEDNPVRIIEVFVDGLNLTKPGFEGAEPAITGRPAYHPATLLKLYLYGYLNRIQSSRRLEREAQRNLELLWLLRRLAPDFKTIADFRKDNGLAIRQVGRELVVLCRRLDLFTEAIVAIDGSKFKAVNNRDKNFTEHKLKARPQQIEESIGRYLTELDRADREPALVTEARTKSLKEKMATCKAHLQTLAQIGEQLKAAPDKQLSLTDPDARSMATSGRGAGMVGYNVQIAVDTRHHLIVAHEVTNVGHDKTALHSMALQARCTTGKQCRRITRSEYEDTIDRMQQRLDNAPQAMRIRRRTVEHPFGTLKAWMGSTHFLTKTLPRVSTEMSLNILAYNLKRMMKIFEIRTLIGVIGA